MINRKSTNKKKSNKRKLRALILGAIIMVIITVVGLYAYRLVMEIQYPTPHLDIVSKYSKKYNIDKSLIYAIIKAESSFNPNAQSPKKALGLMQLTPDTAKWIASKINYSGFNNQKLINPDTNIEFGCWYLNWMKTLDSLNYGADQDIIIAAYNCGNNKVAQWLTDSKYSKDGKKLDVIPYEETENYVSRVNKYYEIYKEKFKNNK